MKNFPEVLQDIYQRLAVGPEDVGMAADALRFECSRAAAGRLISGHRNHVVIGRQRAANALISVQGVTAGALDLEDLSSHGEWIDCPACDYENGDDVRRSMTIRTPDATLARTAWGRTKSHYR